MKRVSVLFMTIVLTSAPALRAQDANPLSTHLKGQWTNIRDLLTRMADKMPDDNYRFKPTAEMQDFGQRMGHAINFNMRGCAVAKGEQKTVMISAMPTKAEIVAAMKDANAECDSVFNTLTDADAMKMIPVGRGGMRPKFALLESNVLEHSQEMYGYMAPYLRLKGIVPPSSEHNEH